jgi:hypothetical protein
MCAVFLEEGKILFLKGSRPMTFELLLDVLDRTCEIPTLNAQ